MRKMYILIFIFSVALSASAFAVEGEKDILSNPNMELSKDELKQKADSVMEVLNSAKRKQDRKEKKITLQKAGDDNFESLLTSNNILVADFSISACAPCAAVHPLLVDMQAKYDNKIRIVRYDCDRNKKIKKQHQIEMYPTVLIFKDGKVVSKLVGGYRILVYLEEEISKALK